MKRAQTVLVVLTAVFALSANAYAKPADDDDDDEDDAPVVKTHKAAAAKPVAKKTEKLADKAAAKPADKTPAKLADDKEAKNPSPVCPESVQVAAQELSKRPENWHYIVDADAKYTLESIMVYKEQDKKFTKENQAKGTESYNEWELPNNGKGAKYFITCSYTHTAILLKHELDASFKSCRVSFATDPANPNAPQQMHKITCQ